MNTTVSEIREMIVEEVLFNVIRFYEYSRGNLR